MNAGPAGAYDRPFDAAALRHGVRRGDADFLTWLRGRVAVVAAPRFSPWAWEWMGDDFFMDLVTQLNVTVSKPEFALQGEAGAYVDTAIRNLCKAYFLRIAKLRRHGSWEESAGEVERQGGTSSLDQVALAMDLTTVLMRMGEACRSLLLGKYIEGLSLKELAAGLGIKPQTARSRLHSCREKLRALWFQGD